MKINTTLFLLFLSSYLIGGGPDISFRSSVVEPEQQAQQWMNNQPVKFLENRGQMKDVKGNSIPFVLFRASAPGMDMYITEKGLTYVFVKTEEEKNDNEEPLEKDKRREKQSKNLKGEMAWINLQLKGANIKRENILREGESEEHYNYFLSHCPNGIINVKQYEKITIKNVYPGIDWVFYNVEKSGMKYDFVVHPGADQSLIRMVYNSETPLELNSAGEIEISTQLGTLTEKKPYCYLQENKNIVGSKFISRKLDENHVEIHFGLEEVNTESTLIIDPQLVWSTFFGGDGASGGGIFRSLETDANGNLFGIGQIGFSYYYPLVDAGTYFDNTILFNDSDMLITKFSSKGILLWATYYGGSQGDYGISAKVNKNGTLYILGITYSGDFPTQNSGKYYDGSLGGSPGNHDDAFMVKFDNLGNRLWASYFGGASYDSGEDLVIDSNGNIFIVGATDSGDLPTKNSGGFYKLASGLDDGFIAEFDPLDNFIWGTFWGGNESTSLFGVTTDIFDNIFITGATFSTTLPTKTPSSTAYYDSTLTNDSVLLYEDFTIAKFSPTHNLLWSTYYGGSNHDFGFDIITDNAGNIFVMGSTFSPNVPVKNSGTFFQNNFGGDEDIFLLKFLPDCSLAWATYYGGTGREEEYGTTSSRPDVMDIDACQNLYIGFTAGPGLVCADPGNSYFDNSYNGDNFSGNPSFKYGDEFVAKFDNSGTLLWGTYIGGKGFDGFASMEIDNTGDLTISGGSAVGGSYPKTNDFPILDQGGGSYFNDTVSYTSNLTVMKFYNPSTPSVSSNFVQSASCSCNGKAFVKLNCATPNISYIWSNGVQNLNTSSSSDSIVGLCPGTYSVKIYTGLDTLNESIIVPGTPGGLTINHTISNVKCKGGNDGRIHIFVSGGILPYTYSWNTSPVQITDSINGLTSGTYIVLVKDSQGCFNMDTIKIQEPAASLKIDSVNVINVTCKGKNDGKVSLFVSGGTAPFSYSWDNGQTTSIISGLSGGNYAVTITDTYGCTLTKSVNVVEPSSLVVTTIGDIICLGDTAIISANGATTYSWIPATGLSATSGSSVNANPSASTTYTVTGFSGGCSGSQTVIVTVNPLPALSITPASPSICMGSSTTLTVNGATTYTWTPATGLSATTGSTITANPTASTTYTVTGLSGSCSGSQTVIVTVNSLPTISITPASASICMGSSTTLTVNGATTYTWTPATGLSATTGSTITANPTASTTYTVTGLSGSCSGSQTVIVSVNPLPTISVTPTSTNICLGNSTTLTVNGATTYTWTPATGLSATTGSSVIASPAASTTYTVTGLSGSCSNSQTVIVTVNLSLTLSVTPISASICSGNSTTLIANGATTYIWTPATGLSITTGSVVTASPLVATTYTVTGVSGACSNSKTVIVNVVSSIDTLAMTTSFCEGDSSAVLHSPKGVSSPYQWLYDTAPITGANADTLLIDPGIINHYSLQWLFNGCVRKTSAVVILNSPFLFLPNVNTNVFTPNNDGVNDKYIPYTNSPLSSSQIDYYIRDFSIQIFNRWGQLIFSSDNYLSGWDGKIKNGSDAPEGVYYWMILYTPRCANSKEPITNKGFLHLLR